VRRLIVKKIGVLGAGTWGMALARMLCNAGNDVLVWITPNKEDTKEMDKAVNYVVYRFAKGEKVNLEKAANIVAITPNTYYNLPKGDSGKFTYVVTALDRLHNESKGKKVKVSF
jgi:UDP-N-acetylmuramoylalanine-D-glutamate ligase